MRNITFLLLFLVFNAACQSSLSKKEAENIIIGTWQLNPYPKPPQRNMNDSQYEEFLVVSHRIINFTKDRQVIDSLLVDYPEEFEEINWEISEDAQSLIFKNKKYKLTDKWQIKTINKDTLWLRNEKNANLLFLSKIKRFEEDRGLAILLPPKKKEKSFDESLLNKRNILKITINAKNQISIRNKSTEPQNLREIVKRFITNPQKDSLLAENPRLAIISYSSDRGTRYSMYIRILDEIKAAYHELRATFLGISLSEYIKFDEKKALEDDKLLNKVKIYCQELNESLSFKMAKKYLNFDIDLEKNRASIKAYQKARNSAPILFIERYYDANRQFPLRIQEAEPTKIGG